MVAWGFDPRHTIDGIRGVLVVRRERLDFVKQGRASGHLEEFPLGFPFPIYGDRFSQGGEASGHYFHQDLLVARAIHESSPQRHIDVGSAVYGFVSHVASFREIEVMDVRPIIATVPGIRFIQQDVMTLDSTYEEIADSVSCLHALEHFGLGRYGEPVDFDGWRKGLKGLTSMLRPAGTLYLSVPTGANQRVEFNAQRIFSLPFLREILNTDYEFTQVSFVTDEGTLLLDVDPFGAEAEKSFGATFGCSIWIIRKK